MTDQGGREPGRQRLAGADQELVAVARLLSPASGRGVPLVGADQHVVEAEAGVGGEQFGRGDQGEAGDRAALAA